MNIIVKQILDQLGAPIKVKSALNKGTHFIISFSAYHLEPGDKVIEDERYSRPHKNNFKVCLVEEPYRENLQVILIVEDNLNMLFFLQSSLKEEYNIFCATDGSAALKLLDEIPIPDLILSDIMMDGMDGFQFYETLVNLEKYSSIPGE